MGRAGREGERTFSDLELGGVLLLLAGHLAASDRSEIAGVGIAAMRLDSTRLNSRKGMMGEAGDGGGEAGYWTGPDQTDSWARWASYWAENG